MKKSLILITSILIFNFTGYGGGMQTNSNQGAAYSRMLARDASTDLDAVYFNPAGVTKLSDGWYLSLSNQFIFQTKYLYNDYRWLNKDEYIAKVSAPLFPDIFLVYKKNKLALSLGIFPCGGGGGASYATGLPSFEMPISDLVPQMNKSLSILSIAGYKVNGYKADIKFDGSSVYLGVQLGLAYELSKFISVAIGERLVYASNVTKGSVKNILINTNNGWSTPGDYLRGIASTPLLGLIIDQVAGLNKNANDLDELTSDKEIEVTQTGMGFTPYFGLCITPSERLTIGFKYEQRTKITLTNNTVKDDLDMYPNGEKTVSEMPSWISLGVGYKITKKLSAQIGIHYYFDKNANYDRSYEGEPVTNRAVIDKNFKEVALGVEYQFTPKILGSLGYLRAITGVNEKFHTDLSYSTSSNTVAFGGRYTFSKRVDFNMGFLCSWSDFLEREFYYEGSGTKEIVKESYKSGLFLIGLGLDIKLNKIK